MIDIFGIRIEKEIDSDDFNYLLNFISTARQERIKGFKFFKDAQRCLFGEILARYAICRRLSIKNTELKFTRNEYGKPTILEPEGLCFNISHSGDWVVCAVDNKPIGVDVEFIKPIDLNIARRFFSSDEYHDLINKENKIKYFYMLWTLKESYVKAVGKGLSIPLKSFSFKIKNNDEIQFYTQNEFSGCSFWQHEIDQKHIVSVCFLKKGFNDNNINVISLPEIISMMNMAEK